MRWQLRTMSSSCGLAVCWFALAARGVSGEAATWCNGLRFATWNIQNFGQSKSSKPAVMRALAQTIARYDLVAIQELSQMPSGAGVCGEHTMSAICDLQIAVNAAGPRDFSLAVSPRIGDEQYVLMYDPGVVSVVDGGQYPDSETKHSRPPYVFVVRVGSKTVAIASTHTKPTEASEEIDNFPAVASWMEAEFEADFNMIVGDYNADGSYFNEDREWAPVLERMQNYSLLTDNDLDTTVARSSNTYDRIIATSDLPVDAIAVFIPEESHNLTDILTEGCEIGYVNSDVCSSVDWVEIMGEMSDHYVVEACLSPEADLALFRTTPAPTPPPAPAFGQPGDCAVVGFSADNPDDFAAVLLAPLDAGHKIFMTDNGVFADGTLRSSEGILSHTAPELVTVGTVLRMANFSQVEQGRVALATSGDQVILFVGTISSPTYTCALSAAGAWQDDASSASTSALPAGLTAGLTALAVPQVDNAVFAGEAQGSPDELRAAIHNFTNWVSSGSPTLTMPSDFIVLLVTATTTVTSATTSTSSNTNTTTTVPTTTTINQVLSGARQPRLGIPHTIALASGAMLWRR